MPGPIVRDGVVAGMVAGVVAGVPSTIHSLGTGRDPLAATEAAGSLLLPGARRSVALAAAVPVHLGISILWGIVMAGALPKRRAGLWGAVAGLAIAGVDLGVVGRRRRAVQALTLGPQIADHVAFGAVAGAVLSVRRARRTTTGT